MIVIKLLTCMIGGFAAHESRRLIDRLATVGLRQLTSYGVGILAAFPFALLLFDDLGDVRQPRRRFALAYFLSLCAFGLGVVAGWMRDAIFGEGWS